MNFTVEKALPSPLGDNLYQFTYTKTLSDVDGNDVTIVDHTDQASLEQLQSIQASLQSQLDEVSAKISSINAIPVVTPAVSPAVAAPTVKS